MGMYTEIRVNAVFTKETPPEVRTIIESMVMQSDFPAQAPKHPFFETARGHRLLTSGSSYFCEDPNQSITPRADGGFELRATASIKNYDGEIAKFADWIRPYCMPQEGPLVTEEYEEYRGRLTSYFQDGHIERDPLPTDGW